MITITHNGEYVADVATIEQAAKLCKLCNDTVSNALRCNRITKSGHFFKRDKERKTPQKKVYSDALPNAGIIGIKPGFNYFTDPPNLALWYEGQQKGYKLVKEKH